MSLVKCTVRLNLMCSRLRLASVNQHLDIVLEFLASYLFRLRFLFGFFKDGLFFSTRKIIWIISPNAMKFIVKYLRANHLFKRDEKKLIGFKLSRSNKHCVKNSLFDFGCVYFVQQQNHTRFYVFIQFFFSLLVPSMNCTEKKRPCT